MLCTKPEPSPRFHCVSFPSPVSHLWALEIKSTPRLINCSDVKVTFASDAVSASTWPAPDPRPRSEYNCTTADTPEGFAALLFLLEENRERSPVLRHVSLEGQGEGGFLSQLVQDPPGEASPEGHSGFQVHLHILISPHVFSLSPRWWQLCSIGSFRSWRDPCTCVDCTWLHSIKLPFIWFAFRLLCWMFNQVVMCVYTRVTEVPKLPRVSQISCEGTTGGKELSPSGQQAAEQRRFFDGLLLRFF